MRKSKVSLMGLLGVTLVGGLLTGCVNTSKNATTQAAKETTQAVATETTDVASTETSEEFVDGFNMDDMRSSEKYDDWETATPNVSPELPEFENIGGNTVRGVLLQDTEFHVGSNIYKLNDFDITIPKDTEVLGSTENEQMVLTFTSPEGAIFDAEATEPLYDDAENRKTKLTTYYNSLVDGMIETKRLNEEHSVSYTTSNYKDHNWEYYVFVEDETDGSWSHQVIDAFLQLEDGTWAEFTVSHTSENVEFTIEEFQDYILSLNPTRK